MNHKTEKENFAFCDPYPKYVIIIRWIILTVAFALGIYILLGIKDVLGVLYVVYSLIALTLILPLSRCASCFYHGKVCNTGWGKVAAYLFPKGDESKFVAHYSYAIFLHLLWLIPLLASFFQFVRKRDLLALIIFFSYLFILLVERVTLKKLACTRCHQREFCPAVPFRRTTKV
jgi:hypothetical protein